MQQIAQWPIGGKIIINLFCYINSIRISEVTGMVVLILFKKAHKQFLQVKNLVSIGNIVSQFKEPNQLLTDPRYKQIESLINNEEFPIVMLLTSIRKEIETQEINTHSQIIDAEIKDLFSIALGFEQLQYIFGCHISALVSRRNNSSDSRELLKHAYELGKSIDVESFFAQNVKKNIKFRDNEIFRNLERQDEANLIQMIASCNVGY